MILRRTARPPAPAEGPRSPYARFDRAALKVALALAPLLTLGGLMVSVRFSVVMFIWCALGIAFVRMYAVGREQVDWLSPGLGLFPILFLYTVAPALRVENTGFTHQGTPVTESELIEFYAASLIGACGLVVGFLVARRGARSAPPPPAEPLLRIDDGTLFKLVIGVAVACALLFFNTLSSSFNFRDVPSYAERALASRLEMRAAGNSGLQEVFFREIPTTFILAAACLLIFRSKSLALRLVGGATYAAYIATNALGGWRGVVVWAVLIPVIFYHYRIKRLRLAHVAGMGLAIYLFMNGLALVRHTSKAGEMWESFNEDISANGAQFARLESTGELMVGSNLITLIQGMQRGTSHYTYGSSVASELAVFVPRAFYADRPLPLAEQFTKEFYPDIYRAGGGFGFFCVMEGYWALGLPGTFVAMLFFGWSVEKVCGWFLRQMKSDFAALWYHSVFLTLVIVSARNGIMGTYKVALMSSLPFLIIGAIAALKFPSQRQDRMGSASGVGT